MSFEITKDTKISEIINQNMMVIFRLKKYGMKCADCLAKNTSSIEECAKTHDVDLDVLINDLSKYINHNN